MKHIILALSLITLITPQTFFAMDFDKEEGIPLTPIYTSNKNNKKPTLKTLDEQLADFNKKIKAEFPDGLTSTTYITRINKELPLAIANNKTVEKYAQDTSSFFGQAIIHYTEAIYPHYQSVTCDTLATITNPSAQQSLKKLNDLPLTIKTYIMERSYDQLDKGGYPYLQLSNNVTSLTIHSTTNLAATVNDIDKTFDLWDLITKTVTTLPKKAIQGGVKFSSNGNQLITVTLAQKNPPIIDVDIWDTHTKNLTHTIPLKTLIASFNIENEQTYMGTLIILDATSNLFLYKIEKNKEPFLLSSIKTSITMFTNSDTRGDYSLNNYDSKLTITKKCPAYFLCLIAIKNTDKKTSLEKIYTATPYQYLEPYAKKLIDEKIDQKRKELTAKETQDKINPLLVWPWFK